MSKIAILTSGGDAPGMNAAIRSLVRSAEFNNIECVGIKKGFQGLIDGSFESLNIRSVSNILGIGGTFLHSARSLDFMQKKLCEFVISLFLVFFTVTQLIKI